MSPFPAGKLAQTHRAQKRVEASRPAVPRSRLARHLRAVPVRRSERLHAAPALAIRADRSVPFGIAARRRQRFVAGIRITRRHRAGR